jgi:hypothetical protein
MMLEESLVVNEVFFPADMDAKSARLLSPCSQMTEAEVPVFYRCDERAKTYFDYVLVLKLR